MADNIYVLPSEDVAKRVPLATDECVIDGVTVHVPRVKLGLGGNGVYSPVTPGQKTMAGSLPIVLASDQSGNAVQGAPNDAVILSDGAGTMSSKLRGLVKWASERMPSSLGQKTMAGSLSVVVASDQPAVPLTWTYMSAYSHLVLSSAQPNPDGNDIEVVGSGVFRAPLASDFSFNGSRMYRIPIYDFEDIAINVSVAYSSTPDVEFSVDGYMGEVFDSPTAGLCSVTSSAIPSPLSVAFINRAVGAGVTPPDTLMPANYPTLSVPAMVSAFPYLRLYVGAMLTSLSVTLTVTRRKTKAY